MRSHRQELSRAKARNGVVDTYRLLYALVIMTGHSVTVGVSSPFPFEQVGIFVEFFLLLTGYFTCETLSKKETKPGEWFTDSLKYTFRKFKPLFPYVAFSVLISYSIVLYPQCKMGGIGQAARDVFNMASEMFLLNYVFSEVGQRVGALYYLSALLVVLPGYCFLCQVKNKSIKLIVAVYAMMLYYHDVEMAVTATYPWVLLRIFCGLLAAMVMFYSVGWLVGKLNQKLKLWGVIGIVLLIIPLILSGIHALDRRIALICEYAGLVLVLSNKQASHSGNVLTDSFARLSMVIYILHWSIGQNINFYFSGAILHLKLVLYYVITIAISITLLFLKRTKRKEVTNDSEV